jgi:adenosylhomocysteinase
MAYKVNDITLASSGEQKILWAQKHMPVLAQIEPKLRQSLPFAGLKIALSVHIEAKTAVLCRMLVCGGAELYATGCNPLSTQDDVAAALAKSGVSVFARHAATPSQYTDDLMSVLAPGPNIIIDDGGDLAQLLHTQLPQLLPDIIGGCEETTTGIRRLQSMLEQHVLRYPVIAVNDAKCKHLFDNRYGTGQSVWDGINRTTNLIVAGKNVVVAGYGWCGKGVALRAKGQGAHVYVTEIDPVKALEAHMDGYDVLQMSEAAGIGDIFVTVTGCRDVITEEHFSKMRGGAVLCNAGHFNVEIDVNWLERNSESSYEARSNIKGYNLGGKTLFVLAEGRLVNLASGDGHPAEIMDMSFSIQLLSCVYLAANGKNLPPGLYPVPEDLDNTVAEIKLHSLSRKIDKLSDAQKAYLSSWQM